MAGASFEGTIRNLLKMKPKPHKPAKGEKDGGGPKAAPDAGSEEQSPKPGQRKDEAE